MTFLARQQADGDGEQGSDAGQHQHCPLAALEDEVLVAAFGGNQ